MDDLGWDERYRSGEYVPRAYPSSLLADTVDWLPDGRALDVATGAGRNAIFLAEHGYDVEGVDLSAEALDVARERAAEAGVEVTWRHADVTDLDLEAGAYDVVHVSFFYDLDLLADLKDALAPGGVLTYEHHLRPASAVDRGPSSDRYRFRSNDLLRACLDLTVLAYRERRHVYERGDRAGKTAAIASIVARRDDGGDAWYPPS